MIKKVFKLILISIVTVVFISCANDTTDPNSSHSNYSSYNIQVLVEKEEYLPVTIKLKTSITESTIGSVTSSDKDKSGNYIATFENIEIYPDSSYKINVYKNNTILIHTEPLSSFKENEIIQLKIY